MIQLSCETIIILGTKIHYFILIENTRKGKSFKHYSVQ